jgi:subtilisin-like proprotein convertase family protein
MRITTILIAVLLLAIAHQSNAQYYTNQYLSLDGINDFLSTPNHGELNFDSAFTVECWVNIKDTSGSNKVIFSKVNSANITGCALLLTGSGSSPNNAGRMQLNINGTSNIVLAGGTRLSLNNWNHIAVTFRDGGGVNISDTIRFYVNGSQSASFNRLIEPIVSNSDSLRIGNCYLPSLYSNGFNGYIDDLKFYKTRRLPAFISADRGIALGLEGFSNNLLLNDTRYAAITSAWRFDGNGFDMVGIQNNFYLRNGATFISTRFNPVTYRNQSNYFMSLPGNSYLVAGDTVNSLYDADTAITVEAWVYVDSLYESVRPIVHKGLSYTLGLTGVGNKPYAQLNNGALLLIANTSIQPRRWTHIAFSYRGSSAWMALYIDGKENIRQNLNPGAILVSNDSLQIGRSDLNVTLNGKVDEVRISRFAKDEASIARYMHTSLDNLNSSQFAIPFVSFGFEGNTNDNVTQSRILFLRGNSYFEWVNAVNTAGGVSQAPLIRLRENDIGSPAASRNALPFSVRNNSTVRDSILVSNVSGSSRLKVVVLLGHTYMDDIDLSLRSPAGTSYILSNDRGGTNNDMLTMFFDLADSSGSDLNAPSSMMIKPQTGFGNAGSNANGYWRLTATDDNATNVDSGIVYRWWVEFEQSTGIVNNFLPSQIELRQNFPNPFNPSTVISYMLRVSGFITLKLYDITGRQVALLEEGMKEAGEHRLKFEGGELAGGAYFYKLSANGIEEVRKLILLR